MKNILVTLLVLLVTACVNGPNTSQQTQSAPAAQQSSDREAAVKIEDITWVLSELNGEAMSFPEGRKPITVRLNSETKQADIFGGINNFSGSYELKEDRIGFGLMMGTLIGGPPEATRIEDAMRKLASGETRFETSAGKLTLTTGTITARFTRS